MSKNIPMRYKSVWKHIRHGGGRGDLMAGGASISRGGPGSRLADLWESGGPKRPHFETMILQEGLGWNRFWLGRCDQARNLPLLGL